jgi:hypothetical protein
MSRKGNCLDNAIENFFGILKSELFYLKKYTSLDQLKKEINDYVNYNNDRIKSNLNKNEPIIMKINYKFVQTFGAVQKEGFSYIANLNIKPITTAILIYGNLVELSFRIKFSLSRN